MSLPSYVQAAARAAPAGIGSVLFDKDGTLLDFTATWVPAARTAADVIARRFGAGVPAEALLDTLGFDHGRGEFPPSSPVTTGSLAEVADAFSSALPDVSRDALLATTLRCFADGTRGRHVAKEGLADVVRELRGMDLALGVVTMDTEAGARDALAWLEVAASFCFVAGSDSGYGHKPGGGMVDAYLRASGASAASVCVVGDTLHDVRMGRAAQVALVVGVTSGAGDPETLRREADVCIGSLRELPAVLKGYGE